MAVTIVLGVMGYLATQILAMAVVMQAILSGTETFAGIGLVSCVVISSAVLIFYCVTGGIIASVYTDVVQGAIMIVAGSLILMTAMSVFEGGMQEATSIIWLMTPRRSCLLVPLASWHPWAGFLYLAWVLPGNPISLQK
jgi:Na+/proline symporter